MPYDNQNKGTEITDTKPIEVIPLSESFKEDLITLYERYAPKESQTNYLGDFYL